MNAARNWIRALTSAACLLLVVSVVAAAPPGKSTSKAPVAKTPVETVDLFDALKAGQIEARFVAPNAREANLFVKNKTGKPLNVRLPEAMGGRPVLKQQNNNAGGGGGSQSMGAGGGGGGGGGLGAFNIAPEKVRRIKLVAVCLDHGKRDPSSITPYEVTPIETVTDKPELVEVIKLYGQGKVGYGVAQAAAWHIQNGLTWQQLAAKRLKRLGQASVSYFNEETLVTAVRLVAESKRLAAAQATEKQPAPQNADTATAIRK